MVVVYQNSTYANFTAFNGKVMMHGVVAETAWKWEWNKQAHGADGPGAPTGKWVETDTYGSFSIDGGDDVPWANGKTVDLSKANSGQLLANRIQRIMYSRRIDPKLRFPYLEEAIDVGTRFHPHGGWGPITNQTSGMRTINGDKFKITIWMREDKPQHFAKRSSDNQLRAGGINSFTNPVNKKVTYILKFVNTSTGASVINFESESIKSIRKLKKFFLLNPIPFNQDDEL